MVSDRQTLAVAVLGAGAWGTAIAVRLAAEPARRVRLWGHRPEALRAIAQSRLNPRLPGIAVPERLNVCVAIEQALEGADVVLLAAPIAATEPLAQAVARLRPQAFVLSLAKGFVATPAEARDAPALALAHEALARAGCARAGLFAGPSFAHEVAQGLPLALVCALERLEEATTVARWLRDPGMRIYATADRTGVALCGALKNVYAIGAGVSDGLGLGANARAALVTRSLAELRRLVLAAGGSAETVAGLAGVGDLMLSTSGDASRNRQLGLALARGEPVEAIAARLGHVVEGVASASHACAYAARLGVEMPIAETVAALLTARMDAQAAIRQLLEREPRAEF
ncbi:MAG: NAD(P)-dependent glycerol-3-phosphate dehydrogenase [Casimicrobiaceae bacterium]|nr:NAD(P)-dependent glycerol-3-phosphate dehydrogenase [Casimicrobiaceae bacterium]